ncbi:MAG TPA: ATP-binding protein [Thermoanaerobaculia bacterium]|nr:ATP-binding protein [Thermoanaerobaculia bacterium]
MKALFRLQTSRFDKAWESIRGYGVAVLVTGMILLASVALRQVLEDAVPLVLFILAVMVSAWYGGMGPGVLSSVLSVFAGNYFLMEPARSFSLSSPSDWLRVAAFLVTAGVVSSLSESLHEARRQAELQAGALREADRRKDEFLAMLSHELRNPLAAIHNAVQILAACGHDPAQVEKIRGLLERQLSQLVRLVDDLLDLSRVTRGQIRLRRGPVNLAEVVSTAVETSRPLIDARGHQLTVALPETPLHIDADAARLAQVLSNLLNNAAKYTRAAGRIDLAAEGDDGEVCLRVRDTGIGIAPEVLPRVFDLFVQAESSTDRTEGGLGVGLTLARQLVEMHGGTIEARSAGLGMGTEIVVRLPALPPAVAEMAPGRTASPRSGTAPVSPLKILVVDDNRDSAESLALLMGMTGHEVRTAYDGQFALVEARAFEPDVVVLDIGLPGMDGYQVAHHLRQEPGGERRMLLALTGYGQEEDRRRSLAAGFDHHLVKPIDLERFKELLESRCRIPVA